MSTKLICIDKLRNKYNKIYSYVLIDNNNSVVSLSPDELKTLMRDTSNMFAYCGVTELDFSSFDTSKVTNMHSMFMSCLVNILDLSSFDTSKVVSMEYMFNNCMSKEINLISFNTTSLENDIYIFYKCKANIKCRDIKLLKRIEQERKRSNNK